MDKLKDFLSNNRRRQNWPDALVHTEFDPIEGGLEGAVCAGFHIVFNRELTPCQQKAFCKWYVDVCGAENNQGGLFHYGAMGGGLQLKDYSSKDVVKRGRKWRWVKFKPEWVPARPGRSLWFTVGIKRMAASVGRAMRAGKGFIRRRYDSAQGMHPVTPVQSKYRPPEFKPAARHTSLTPLGENYQRLFHELTQLSSLKPCGETLLDAMTLTEASYSRLLSIRTDMGAIEVAHGLHTAGNLRYACSPQSGDILHMLVSPDAKLPVALAIRLTSGTAIPRNFETVYLSA